MRLTVAPARRRRALAIAAVAAAGLLAAGAGRADAYPQFQLALGERCSTCHLSPAGGGLLNDYGRTEAGDSISRGGDGRFLHGAWEPPPWIRLGADLRGAALVKQQAADREWIAFPMQTDLYVRAGSERVSLTLTAGLRGGARDPQPALAERLGSREHYVMIQAASGAYVRAGRFFPVLGLRSQDHTAAVRRYLGLHTLEEPYGLGAGAMGDDWEAHASLFVPRPIDVLGSGVMARGAAIYAERRILDGTAAIAGQARVAISDADARAALGVVGKRWWSGAGVLLLAELDLQRQAFADAIGPTRYQLAGYLGASKAVARGVLVGASIHRWQPDLRLRTARDAAQVDVQVFPRAHFELHWLTRVSGSGDYDDPGVLSMLQLHYYL
jgi:hypothetical protein